MNDFTHVVGLLRREFRDTHAVVSNIDHRTRKLVDPPRIARPAGLIARLAAATVMARTERRGIDVIARQNFPNDTDLAALITMRAATGPAMTSQTGWAAELVVDAVMDVAQNLLGDTVLAQLRARGLSYAFVPGRGIVRVPMHTPTPSGAFIGESGAIPVSAMILGSMGLKPKKAAAITATTRELMNGAASNVETSLRVLLGEDMGLMVDGILLGSAAATPSQPPGLLNGLTPIAPTTGGGLPALLGDIKALLTAIAPAIRPVLITGTVSAATIGMLAPASAVPVIVAPTMTANSIAAIDAAAFASAVGIPEFLVDENPTVHMDTVPSPISEAGTPNTVAAPVQSLWQTASIGIRSLLDCDWALRRSTAVAVITGTTW